jgi:hypothetical protein
MTWWGWAIVAYGTVFLVGLRPLAGAIAWDAPREDKADWGDGYRRAVGLLIAWPLIVIAGALFVVGACGLWLLEAATFFLRFGPEADAIKAGKTHRVRPLPEKLRNRLGVK